MPPKRKATAQPDDSVSAKRVTRSKPPAAPRSVVQAKTQPAKRVPAAPDPIPTPPKVVRTYRNVRAKRARAARETVAETDEEAEDQSEEEAMPDAQGDEDEQVESGVDELNISPSKAIMTTRAKPKPTTGGRRQAAPLKKAASVATVKTTAPAKKPATAKQKVEVVIPRRTSQRFNPSTPAPEKPAPAPRASSSKRKAVVLEDSEPEPEPEPELEEESGSESEVEAVGRKRKPTPKKPTPKPTAKKPAAPSRRASKRLAVAVDEELAEEEEEEEQEELEAPVAPVEPTQKKPTPKPTARSGRTSRASKRLAVSVQEEEPVIEDEEEEEEEDEEEEEEEEEELAAPVRPTPKNSTPKKPAARSGRTSRASKRLAVSVQEEEPVIEDEEEEEEDEEEPLEEPVDEPVEAAEELEEEAEEEEDLDLPTPVTPSRNSPKKRKARAASPPPAPTTRSPSPSPSLVQPQAHRHTRSSISTSLSTHPIQPPVTPRKARAFPQVSPSKPSDSPSKSPSKPSKFSESPLKSALKSPSKSPLKSPSKSPQKSPSRRAAPASLPAHLHGWVALQRGACMAALRAPPGISDDALDSDLALDSDGLDIHGQALNEELHALDSRLDELYGDPEGADDDDEANEVAFAQLRDLLGGTVGRGEGNSCMVLGPRGSGKSRIVDQCLAELSNPSSNPTPIIIRLSGYVQHNDRLALREIAAQLNQQTGASFLDESADESADADAEDDDDDANPFLDHATKANANADTQTNVDTQTNADTQTNVDTQANANEPTLLALPPSSHLPALISVLPTLARPVIVVLDALDLFALHARQALLYCLLDTVQSCRGNRGAAANASAIAGLGGIAGSNGLAGSSGIALSGITGNSNAGIYSGAGTQGASNGGLAVIGVTCRVDTINLLEKRVKSRFSGRMLRTAAPRRVRGWVGVVRGILGAPVLSSPPVLSSEMPYAAPVLSSPLGRDCSREQEQEVEELGDAAEEWEQQKAEWNEAWTAGVARFLEDKTTVRVIEETFSVSRDVRLLVRMMTSVILALTPTAPFPSPAQLVLAAQTQRSRPAFPGLYNLPYPSVCLLIASIHAQTAGYPVVTFEMLYDFFRSAVRSSSAAPVQVNGGSIGMVKCSREVLMSAFAGLVSSKILVCAVAPTFNLGQGFIKYRCAVGREDVLKAVERTGQTNLKRWLKKAN